MTMDKYTGPQREKGGKDAFRSENLKRTFDSLGYER